jgi:hypothetical protein
MVTHGEYYLGIENGMKKTTAKKGGEKKRE